MIRIIKKLRKEKGLYLVVTGIDAKAAHITTKDRKEIIEDHFERLLKKLADNVDDDMAIKNLKDFLTETVFTHYVDKVGILNYINDMRQLIRVNRKYPSHSKFLFVIEFKNYSSDESDSNADKEDFISTSFDFKLLKKNNLKFVEKTILSIFNLLYTESIIVSELKKVEVFLREKEVLGKQKEFMNIDMTFVNQTK